MLQALSDRLLSHRSGRGHTAEGKLYLFVAIDRTSKFAVARLVAKAGKMAAAQVLRDLIAAVPYRIHTILMDNGIQFTHRKRDLNAFGHIFDRVCRRHDIQHRLTKAKHPWTNGQVERVNRTIKDVTVKRFHYDSHNQFRRHLQDFLDAYNFARRLKTLSQVRNLAPFCEQIGDGAGHAAFTSNDGDVVLEHHLIHR